MTATATSHRVTAAALILLALALHARDLLMGFPDQDLVALDTVLRTSLPGLLRGGALPEGFTPLSRELWLWWWGKTVGLGSIGFHLIGAAVAAGTVVGVAKLADARAGWIAAALLVVFPPLGSMLSSVLSARDLLAAGACVASLALYARGRSLLAGLLAGVAAASRESAALFPLVLWALDLRLHRSDPLGARVRRLAPAFLAAAGALVWIFQTRPWTVAVSAQSLPRGLGASWFPPGTRAGLAGAWKAAPWLLVAAAAFSFFAIPPDRAIVREKRAKEPAPKQGARPAASSTHARWLGLALLLAGLAPLAVFGEARRAEGFLVPAVGLALVLGDLLARAPRAVAGALVAVLAIVSFGANNLVTSEPKPFFTSHARLGAEAARTAPALAALGPWKQQLRTTPRVFVPGIPADSTYRLVFGPGARVALHHPNASIRFLGEMTPDDAARPVGVLRYDPQRQGFLFERGTPGVRARLGEGLLVFGRHEVAAACFAAAAAERPDDPELVYPWTIALAAAGHPDEARARWSAAKQRGLAPPADTLAAHLLVGLPGARADSALRAMLPLARAVTSDPAAGPPHIALGRSLLDLGRARSAAIELSVGCGIGKRSEDLVWLARAYDDMGAKAEALETYRTALAGGLDSTTYRVARRRFAELLRGSAGASLRGPS